MLITITNLRHVTGAAMVSLQASSGVFILDDVLVLDAEAGDEATAALAVQLPAGSVRRSTPAEAAAWALKMEAVVRAYAQRQEHRAAVDAGVDVARSPSGQPVALRLVRP